MKLKTVGILTAIVFGVSGCATTQNTSGQQYHFPPMAIPLQPSLQDEVQIARLSQVLQREELGNEVKAKLHFERGYAYDNVGLRELARFDYNQSLSFDPAQPDVYNILGVSLTEVGEYDAAYDAFDSAIELDSEHDFAYRNRAIALYYGSRFSLAEENITQHVDSDPQDPFRLLWRYIIVHERDSELARHQLLSAYAERDEKWSWVLVAAMLDLVTEEQAFELIREGVKDNRMLAQRLTELYFYLGKRYQLTSDYALATSLYKLAISFNVYEYIEHRYAQLELSNIYVKLKKESEEQVSASN